MIRHLCTLAFVLLSLVPPVAPPPPDFSGTWVEDRTARKPSSAPASGGSLALPESDTVIRQTPTSIAIETRPMSAVIRYVYALDGTESVNHNGANTLTTRTRWDGQVLVTEGTSFSVTSQGESTWTYRESRRLDRRVAMIVDLSYTDAAGKVTASTRTFVKKPE